MVTIELQESVVSRLSALANAEGLSLEAYLGKLSESAALESGRLPPLTVEEFDRFLDQEASSNPTYQGTYSRADIYLDHD